MFEAYIYKDFETATTYTVCDNITLLYRSYETKRKRNDLFCCIYETPHPFKRNGRSVLKRFIAEQRSQKDSSLNKTMKNNSHCLWTSGQEQRDTWGMAWHKSRACNWTAVVSSSSLILCSASAFTGAVIFVGQPEPGLLSMLFVSLCFCRNLCIPIQLAIKPSSRNMR